MKFTLITSVLTTLTTLSLAAPVAQPAADLDTRAAPVPTGIKWSIVGMQLTVNPRGTQAGYSFTIQVPGQAPVPCSAIAVSTKPGVSATTQPASGKCGAFTVTSNWSNQFGDKNAFRVFAVRNAKYISYPGYTDDELFSTLYAKPFATKSFDTYAL